MNQGGTGICNVSFKYGPRTNKSLKKIIIIIKYEI